MFGYIACDNPNLYIKDLSLYRAFYCGLCKSLGKHYGQRARLSVNYDMSFLCLFYHNILNLDIEIKKERCITHWIVKRLVAKDDALFRKLAGLNVILTYYKLQDDVLDEGKGRIKAAFFKRQFNKAKRENPELEKIVKDSYQNLCAYEKSGEKSIDKAADAFGAMFIDICKIILKQESGEATENICYSVGKWVYLIDALDDYDKDIKKKNYNPFVLAYGAENKKNLIEKHGKDIEFIFSNIMTDIAENNRKSKYCFNHDLIDNILEKGIPKKTRQILDNQERKTKNEKLR